MSINHLLTRHVTLKQSWDLACLWNRRYVRRGGYLFVSFRGIPKTSDRDREYSKPGYEEHQLLKYVGKKKNGFGVCFPFFLPFSCTRREAISYSYYNCWAKTPFIDSGTGWTGARWNIHQRTPWCDFVWRRYLVKKYESAHISKGHVLYGLLRSGYTMACNSWRPRNKMPSSAGRKELPRRIAFRLLLRWAFSHANKRSKYNSVSSFSDGGRALRDNGISLAKELASSRQRKKIHKTNLEKW